MLYHSFTMCTCGVYFTYEIIKDHQCSVPRSIALKHQLTIFSIYKQASLVLGKANQVEEQIQNGVVVS